MTSDDNNNSSKKNKGFKEIEIEQKDLLNVFFDKSHSQFESQLFLSRKRMLSAENGQNELSELLKSKLKALDMMIFILTNNKTILKESDLSCCEVLNNLLCVSKKDKSYGEHIYSKIKSVALYIIKNQLFLKEKNIESIKVIIKFLITLFNIKFDNGYFKQALEIISSNQEICSIFIKELLDKLFKGRNITIKLKEMKFILKSLLSDEKIMKFMKFFDLLELILSYAHEKENGGSRTSFQLNQVVFLLQYLIEILNLKEINQNLPDKQEKNQKLIKILNDFKNSVNEFVDKNDYMEEKMNKKEIAKRNEKIKRKKVFFSEMNKFLNKLKKYFKNEFEDKEINKIVGEINDLYKNTISVKYTVIINANNNKKNEKEKNNKNNNDKKKDNTDKEKEDNQEDDQEDDKEDDFDNREEGNNENESEDNESDGMKLDEEKEEEKKDHKKQIKKNKVNKEEKINKSNKPKENKHYKDSKKVNKNKKKKEH